jgi:hypothetical protein
MQQFQIKLVTLPMLCNVAYATCYNATVRVYNSTSALANCSAPFILSPLGSDAFKANESTLNITWKFTGNVGAFPGADVGLFRLIAAPGGVYVDASNVASAGRGTKLDICRCIPCAGTFARIVHSLMF